MLKHHYYDIMKRYFNGDDKKTMQWFRTSHSNLGMFSPMDMLKLGKHERVKKLIETQYKVPYERL